MLYRKLPHLVWLSCVAAAVVGCQSADVPSSGSADAAAGALANKKSADANGPDDPSADAARNAAAQAAVARKFTPPFPNRVDLFEPPKRDEGRVHRGDNTEELVELKGFVNVDGPRVVLSIDGVVAPLAEGGEKYGVQVISIHPPSVVLQRGRSRWTATLE